VKGYPVRVTLLEDDGSRSRLLAAAGIAFMRILLVLPHLLILVLLVIPTLLAAYVINLSILFARTMPVRLANFVAETLLRLARIATWITSCTDAYPPLRSLSASYPVQLHIPERYRGRNRFWAFLGLVFLKVVVALPFLVVAIVLLPIVLVVGWVTALIVLAKGHLPGPLRRFLMGSVNFALRPLAWLAGLTDKLPTWHWDRGRP
jgi:uncharacterized membrane protein